MNNEKSRLPDGIDHTLTMHVPIEHITKWKPAGEPAALPHNMPLWNDLYAFFNEIYSELPEVDHLVIDPDTLIMDLQARFQVTYNQEQLESIKKMLQTGYKHHPQGYECYRADFIKPVTN